MFCFTNRKTTDCVTVEAYRNQFLGTFLTEITLDSALIEEVGADAVVTGEVASGRGIHFDDPGPDLRAAEESLDALAHALLGQLGLE